MQEKITHANQQAVFAHEKAMRAGDLYARDEWLSISRVWKEVAQEFAEISKSIGTAVLAKSS